MNEINETHRSQDRQAAEPTYVPDTRTLLDRLAEMEIHAEREGGDGFRRAFYPVPEHLYALEPNVQLIIGHHGAGKSTLFKAAAEGLIPPKQVRSALGFDWDRVEWRVGFPSSEMPTTEALFEAAKELGENSFDLAKVWLFYLLRVLGDQTELRPFADVLELPADKPLVAYKEIKQLRAEVVGALDALDRRLQAEDRWCFVGYDALDLLFLENRELSKKLLRGLLVLWIDQMRRWRRLQPKIFLRTDLFKSIDIMAADFAVMASKRVELRWGEKDIYAMLAKRLANLGEEWRRYCESAGISFEPDDRLGYVPSMTNSLEVYYEWIDRMVEQHDGHPKEKRWADQMLDYVRDGAGRIMPGLLIGLWVNAAKNEQSHPQASEGKLIHPNAFSWALDRVSDEHVQTLQAYVMPWLAEVRKRLSGREMPLTQQEWVELLERDWEQWFGDERVSPPCITPQGLLGHLLEHGVCRELPGGRIDVPKLFLYGLGVNRQGGVQPTRQSKSAGLWHLSTKPHETGKAPTNAYT